MARKRSDPNRIAVMDTTLRDGEQTPNVAYTAAEKFQLARMLLEEVGVDRHHGFAHVAGKPQIIPAVVGAVLH